VGVVGRLGEGDFAGERGFRAVAGELPDAQAGQTAFALGCNKETGE